LADLAAIGAEFDLVLNPLELGHISGFSFGGVTGLWRPVGLDMTSSHGSWRSLASLGSGGVSAMAAGHGLSLVRFCAQGKDSSSLEADVRHHSGHRASTQRPDLG
jgi:hypothetical protein